MGKNRNQQLQTKKFPKYTQTLFWIFIVPFILLFKTILKNVQKKPFFIAIAIVCLLGWSWSMILSYTGWWEFPEEFILGFHVLPYLPLEEFLIYPLGGAFSIFLYMFPTNKFSEKQSPLIYWIFVLAVTALFGILAFVKRGTEPYYLYSQLVLYNGLCLVFASKISKEINIIGLFSSLLVLSLIGYFWDWAAFRNDWWIYHAITGIKFNGIPVEDFNFYLLAPTAAISLYIGICRYLNLSQKP
ncbi:hypothetical protein BVX98_01625 [bacterium F11]|nr:hypothetical protein BVX98_01625 [bacterium F11]